MTQLNVSDIHIVSNVRLEETDIEGLARSMNAIGLVTPITVVQNEEGYALVSGHRRLAAAVSLDWSQIEAYVSEAGDKQLAQQLAENISRNALTPYEIAQGVLALRETAGMNQADIADALGMDKRDVSTYQKIAKGSAGFDELSLNQLTFASLEVFENFHDAPDEMRTRLHEVIGEDVEGGYWIINDYIAEVEKWRWSQRKENKPLIKALDDIGAVPMDQNDRHQSKRLAADEVMVHRGQPCHGYLISRSWTDTDGDFVINEYCMAPQSHVEDEDKPELVKMSEEAAAKNIGGTVAQSKADKERRARKDRRKMLVANFARDPKMKPLTEMLYITLLDIQKPYRWTELGKAFGLSKPKDTYHYDWEEGYLNGFAGKEQLVQQLILAVGSVYIGMETTYSVKENEALKDLDRLFGFDETPTDVQ